MRASNYTLPRDFVWAIPIRHRDSNAFVQHRKYSSLLLLRFENTIRNSTKWFRFENITKKTLTWQREFDTSTTPKCEIGRAFQFAVILRVCFEVAQLAFRIVDALASPWTEVAQFLRCGNHLRFNQHLHVFAHWNADEVRCSWHFVRRVKNEFGLFHPMPPENVQMIFVEEYWNGQSVGVAFA